MAGFSYHQLVFAFGLLGAFLISPCNVVSFMVFLAPVPTFYRIIKKKSTEGFQSIPYSVALFSAMLMLYYAFVKTNALFLITINSIGSVIESIYLIVYLIYATKTAKINTAKLIVLFNFGAFGLIVLLTFFIWEGPKRACIVGWICAVFSVCVFAAPLSIMRRVVKTKSVEYMPFSLSFFLTLCAVMWFFYGLLLKDYYIATPNVLGFTFGIAQMIVYGIYKNANKSVLPEWKKPQKVEKSIQINKLDVQKNPATDYRNTAAEAAEKNELQNTPTDKNKQEEHSNGGHAFFIEIPEMCKGGSEKAEEVQKNGGDDNGVVDTRGPNV